jgi:carbamoyltransferase
MNVLGITDGVVSGAAVIQDGQILAAVNEERLIRYKMAIGFPDRAIDEVLRLSEMKPQHIDVVAVATHNEHFRRPAVLFKGWFQDERGWLKWLQMQLASWMVALFGASSIVQAVYYALRLPAAHKRKKAVQALLKSKWGFQCPVKFIDHHDCHVAAAYYTSGFKDATVISIDGGGDGKAAKVYKGEGGNLTEIFAVNAYDSMGNFYAYITHLCGFKAHKHEGKITGLAAYGKPLYKDILASMIDFEDGNIVNKSRSYYYSSISKLKKKLPQDFKIEDLSASMQQHLEDVCVKFVQYWVQKTGLSDVAIAGGVAANVKMNQRIHEIPAVYNLFIFPAMGDEGLAVGAAYCVWAGKHDFRDWQPYRPLQMYFGADFSKQEVEQLLKNYNVDYEFHEDIEKKVAELLAHGHVVARFAGKMEYGPRALGNRTIMYQATDQTVNDWLNKRLDRTEFMPFAPVTLKEYADKCYRNMNGASHAARFMTITFDCTDWMKKHCPAVVHVDGTARPQLIDKDLEPSYYRIVDEYRKITGLPCVINTSFNMHEEPIVCTPYDALRAFQLGHLDFLAINQFLIKNSIASGKDNVQRFAPLMAES